MPKFNELIKDNFLYYASYVICDRAIPHLDDGLKPVQRRILHTLMEMDDGRFHKVSNVIGACMKYHPHGDQSISAALVNLAQKGLFIETQGNFGNIFTGDEASAPRYIECRITPFAKSMLHYPKITDYVDSYDGRNKEPSIYPAMLPLVLLLGVEGIAVGMSTTVLPHAIREIITAMRNAIKGGTTELFPDFVTGGVIDVQDYDDGMGRVKVRAKIEVIDDKRLLITELPYGKTTESLIHSIEQAAQKKKCSIAEINDFTTDTVEIELKTSRGIAATEVLDSLYAFTDCEVSIRCELLVIQDGKPRRMRVSEVIAHHAKEICKHLKTILQVEYQERLKELRLRNLERIFIEERIYRHIEKEKTPTAIIDCVKTHMHSFIQAFPKEYAADLSKEEIDHLLRIPIRRISLYDIEKAKQDELALQKALADIRVQLSDIPQYALEFLNNLEKKYLSLLPERKSRIRSFERVIAKSVAVRNIPVFYDEKRLTIGTKIRSGEKVLTASSFDRLLLLRSDGHYSVVPLPEKLVCGNLVFCGLAAKDSLQEYVFTVVFANAEGQAYVKRCQILQFILNRAYSIIPEQTKLLACSLAKKGKILLEFDPKGLKRGSKKTASFLVQDFAIKGVKSKGQRLHIRTTKSARIKT